MNSIHIHLTLNHVPVLGSYFLLLLFCTALWKRNRDLCRLALQWLVVLSVIAIPIKFTGDFAADDVAGEPWLEADRVSQHEQSADQATTGVFLMGIVAALALYLSRGDRTLPRWVVITLLVATSATALLMTRAAFYGGQIRHTEIRGTDA